MLLVSTSYAISLCIFCMVSSRDILFLSQEDISNEMSSLDFILRWKWNWYGLPVSPSACVYFPSTCSLFSVRTWHSYIQYLMHICFRCFMVSVWRMYAWARAHNYRKRIILVKRKAFIAFLFGRRRYPLDNDLILPQNRRTYVFFATVAH